MHVPEDKGDGQSIVVVVDEFHRAGQAPSHPRKRSGRHVPNAWRELRQKPRELRLGSLRVQ